MNRNQQSLLQPPCSPYTLFTARSMVPIPVWERPEERTYDPNEKTDAAPPTDLPESAKTSTNVSGRWWKGEHKATTRSQNGAKDAQQQSKTWAAREERRKREEAVKKLER